MQLMGTPRESPQLELAGGALCLDFANTLEDRPRSTQEHLWGYGDLLGFSRQTEALPAADIDRLARLSAEHPRCAHAVFTRAIGFRETLYRIFTRLAGGEFPEAEDLELLNGVLHKALPNLQIRDRHEGFEWTWGGQAQALDRPLWPIARSAAELLTSEELANIRECASETCSWLFVDRSRNHRRRWCDMATCGNRAKARRHYQRRKRTRARS